MTSQTSNIVFPFQLGVHLGMLWYSVKAIMSGIWVVWSNKGAPNIKRELWYLQNIAVFIFWWQGRRLFHRQNLLFGGVILVQFAELILLLYDATKTLGCLVASEFTALCCIMTSKA